MKITEQQNNKGAVAQPPDNTMQKAEKAPQDKTKSNVSEQQQDLYDIFVGKSIELAGVHAQRLKDQENVTPENVAEIMFQIVSRTEEDAQKNGIQFDMAIKLKGSENILKVLLNMGGVKFNEQQYRETIGRMVPKYLKSQVQGGKMTEQEVIQLAQQAQQSLQQENPDVGVLGRAQNGQT